MKSYIILFTAIISLFSTTILGWQDDVAVKLYDPITMFSWSQTPSFFIGGEAEVRLGRYAFSGENHDWRAGIMGDISLIQFTPHLLWHMGLNIETLADGKNDIHFRLVQVYYQALTTVKWRIADHHVLQFGYDHRCNHGADEAEPGRITIRSGLFAGYHWFYYADTFKLDVKPGLNIFIIGQNRDLSHQSAGELFLTAQASWPIVLPWHIVIGAGSNLALVGNHHRNVFVLGDQMTQALIKTAFGARMGVRLERARLTTDIALHFAQNHDSGIGHVAQNNNLWSLDIDFHW